VGRRNQARVSSLIHCGQAPRSGPRASTERGELQRCALGRASDQEDSKTRSASSVERARDSGAFPSWWRESRGGTEGMLQLVFDVLHEVSADPLLGPCFGPRGSERVTRLGWWLIEVLGGPKLYALTVPEQPLRDGPLPDAPLDVEERAQLLQIVRRALFISGGRLHCALSALEANLPLHPALPSGPRGLLPKPRTSCSRRRVWHHGPRSSPRKLLHG
jgi:truncated hemoglobin YjbI